MSLSIGDSCDAAFLQGPNPELEQQANHPLSLQQHFLCAPLRMFFSQII
jgi:hypothetical protein